MLTLLNIAGREMQLWEGRNSRAGALFGLYRNFAWPCLELKNAFEMIIQLLIPFR